MYEQDQRKLFSEYRKSLRRIFRSILATFWPSPQALVLDPQIDSTVDPEEQLTTSDLWIVASLMCVMLLLISATTASIILQGRMSKTGQGESISEYTERVRREQDEFTRAACARIEAEAASDLAEMKARHRAFQDVIDDLRRVNREVSGQITSDIAESRDQLKSTLRSTEDIFSEKIESQDAAIEELKRDIEKRKRRIEQLKESIKE